MIDNVPLSKFFTLPRSNWKPLTPIQEEGVKLFNEMVENEELQYERIACPCCRMFSYDLLSQVDKYGIAQDIVICKNCGLVYNNPQLTEASYIKVYDSVYRQIYMGYKMPSSEYNAYFQLIYEDRGKRYSTYTEKMFPDDLDGKFVVEIGCGAGGILYRFKELGAEVLGFDYDSQYINFGRKEYGLNLIAGDYQEYKFKTKPDLIILGHVLEHLIDYRSKLATIQKIMKPDSILLIEVPSLLGRRFGWTLQMAHTSYFTSNTLHYSLQTEGYKIVAAGTHGTHLYCVATLDQDGVDPPISLDNEYQNTLSYLHMQERLGRWAYYKHHWFYPLIRPLEIANILYRDPTRIKKRLQRG